MTFGTLDEAHQGLIHRSPLPQKSQESPRETDPFIRRTQFWRGSHQLSSDSWCVVRWVGPVEDHDFAKQNDRDSAARPLAYLPTKPLKQGCDVR